LTRVRVRRESGSSRRCEAPVFFQRSRAVNICVNHLIKLRSLCTFFGHTFR